MNRRTFLATTAALAASPALPASELLLPSLNQELPPLKNYVFTYRQIWLWLCGGPEDGKYGKVIVNFIPALGKRFCVNTSEEVYEITNDNSPHGLVIARYIEGGIPDEAFGITLPPA